MHGVHESSPSLTAGYYPALASYVLIIGGGRKLTQALCNELPSSARITLADAPDQAARILRKRGFDLVISGIGESEQAMLDTLRAIRPFTPNNYVVQVAAKGIATETIGSMVHLGVRDVLVMPIGRYQLESLLDHALEL